MFWWFYLATIFPAASSLGLLVPWDTTILKQAQLITLQWPLIIQVTGFKMHFTSKMMKLNEKRHVESQVRLKARPLVPNSCSSCEWKGKILKGNEKCRSSEHTNGKEANNLTADREKVLVFCMEEQTNHNIPLSQSLILSETPILWIL